MLTPPSGEQAPVLNANKLADEDTKVLLELRPSVRMPVAQPSTVALEEEDLEEFDIEVDLEPEMGARRGRASERPRSRPSQGPGADDTVFGMNTTNMPPTPRLPRPEADDERTQVMDPRTQKNPDPDATVRISRKR